MVCFLFVAMSGGSVMAAEAQSSQTFHGGVAGVPEAVQLGPVAEGVHAHPEALVPEDAQLAVGGQRLQRLLLEQQVGVVVEVLVDDQRGGRRRSRR